MNIRVLVMACAALLSACASRPPASNPAARAAYEAAHDPMEPANRAIFKFNTGFDKAFVRPTATAYRAVTPVPVRRAVGNVVSNWLLPYTFGNELLQAQPRRAFTTLGRFAVNTTVGVAGIADPASKWGLEKHQEDFGQTFAVWGVPDGPYMMLPFFGPSNPRDFAGSALEFFYEPFSYVISHDVSSYASYTFTGAQLISFRERNMEVIDNEAKSSVDYYATVRKAWQQSRCAKIHNGDSSKCGTRQDQEFPESFE